jgi:hypothetical protein
MRIESKSDVLVLAGLIALATGGAGGCGSDDGYVSARKIVAAAEGENVDGSGPAGSCVPSETRGPVDDRCGVWVAQSGNDGNAGLRIAPVKTLTEAIERVWYKGKRIYVCAETFEDEVLVPAGYSVYGGLDCQSDWSWIGDRAKTTLTAPEAVVPLSFHGGEGLAQIEDFHVVARSIDPGRASTRGASSIAVSVQGVAVRFARSTLEAGDAAPGEPGAPYAESAARPGLAGAPGNLACTSASIPGGAAALNECGTPDDPSDDSGGGDGGRGRIPFGEDGAFGLPLGAINRGEGESDSRVCTDGRRGEDGADGALGAGAAGHGRLSPSGYVGPWGRDGKRGGPGQGGGGGGGSKGGSGGILCPVPSAAGGASGGAGGTGGCGGLGGRGGGPGGSSIALVSLSGTLLFEDTVLIAGRGGSGGDGGEGQAGGTGAEGGIGGGSGVALGLHAACSGGTGGAGGSGGKGGGGLGGYAVGIAYTAVLPKTDGTTIHVGEAGKAGLGADADHDGAPGVSAATYDFAD